MTSISKTFSKITLSNFLVFWIIHSFLICSCTDKSPQAPVVDQIPSKYGVVFNALDKHGLYSVYKTRINENEPEKLFIDCQWIGDLKVSHDGTQIMCCAKIDENYALYSIRVDGSGFDQITPLISTFYFEPQWFPNDSEILVARYDFHAHFYRILTHESSIMRITTNDSISYRFPRLSPNGSKIAFEKRTHPVNTIWTMSIDGESEHLLSLSSDDAWHPEWTSDGTRLIYFNSDGLWSMHSDGSNHKLLSMREYHHTHDCSPINANEIVFGNSYGINIMNISSDDEATQITDTSCGGYPIIWSNDGSKILFRSNINEDDNDGIAVINRDGTELIEIETNELSLAASPTRVSTL